MKPQKTKTKHNANAFDKALLQFKSCEYPNHEKSLTWFLVAGAVLALLIAYGMSTGSWTFSVALLVFAGTYYLLHREDSKEFDVKISEMGVKIGRHAFPYSSLKNFWMVYDPPSVSKLYFRPAGRFKPDIFVMLEDAPVEEIRKALSPHVKELADTREPFADAVARILKL